jgi:lipopolysaccharide transport system permease protein
MQSVEFEIKPSGKLFFDWRELWQPLFLRVIFTLFFGKTLNLRSQNLPYPVFVFFGLLRSLFSTGLTGSANSMVNNSIFN